MYEQDLAEDEYEIVCVIDGSPDNSQAVVERYMQSHSNIKLIVQENKGVSVARNVGLKNSNGCYVWFVDPDDMITSNCLKKIFDELEKTQADLFELQYRTCEEGYKFTPEIIAFQIDGMNKEGSSGSGWLSVCRRHYLLENNIIFSEELSYGEDYLWAFQTKYRKHISIYTNEALYVYRQRNNSAMNANNLSKTRKHMDDMMRLYHMYGVELKRCEKDNMETAVLEDIHRRRQLCVEATLICMLKLCLPKTEVKKQLKELQSIGAYPYKFMFWNLLGKEKGHSLKVKIVTFLFPIRWYYLLLCNLYQFVKK